MSTTESIKRKILQANKYRKQTENNEMNNVMKVLVYMAILYYMQILQPIQLMTSLYLWQVLYCMNDYQIQNKIKQL